MIRRTTLCTLCLGLVFAFAGNTKASLITYTFDAFPAWTSNNNAALYGSDPIVTLSVDNGSSSSIGQTYDLSTDVVSLTVSTDGGTYSNTWLGSELWFSSGGDYNFVSTDGSGTPTLDLLTARNSRTVFSNASGTWQFGTSIGFTQTWLEDAARFGSSDFAFHSNNGFTVVGRKANAAIPEPSTIAIWSLLGLAGLGYGWRKRKAA